MARKFVSGARSVGITFHAEIIDLIDAIREEAEPEEDGESISRSELVRRLVYMGLDLMRRDHPVLALYTDPDKIRAVP